ncbi:hypothetical protein D3C76_1583830 [compost metagenome]
MARGNLVELKDEEIDEMCRRFYPDLPIHRATRHRSDVLQLFVERCPDVCIIEFVQLHQLGYMYPGILKNASVPAFQDQPLCQVQRGEEIDFL